MNVFRDLLRIKSFREDQAELRMLHQRDVAQQAREAHEAEQRRLERMLREGAEEELRLYGDLCERIVHVSDIEDVQHAVAALRQREDRQKEAVGKALELEREAEQALTQARLFHQEARIQKSKFLDVSSDFDLAMAREAERREDLELEEAASLARDREDWENQDLELEHS